MHRKGLENPISKSFVDRKLLDIPETYPNKTHNTSKKWVLLTSSLTTVVLWDKGSWKAKYTWGSLSTVAKMRSSELWTFTYDEVLLKFWGISKYMFQCEGIAYGCKKLHFVLRAGEKGAFLRSKWADLFSRFSRGCCAAVVKGGRVGHCFAEFETFEVSETTSRTPHSATADLSIPVPH